MAKRPKPERIPDVVSTLTKDERLAFARRVFRHNFFAFMTDCLGYDKLYEPHEEWCREFQRLVEEYIERRPGYSKRELRLMPRGCYKSTIFTVGAALYILVRDPDARILLYSGKEQNAKNFLHEIKKHMTQNAKFRSCFGKWDEGADTWTMTSIVIGRRRRPRKEPSILAIGKGSEITSLHFDVALVDDIVTRDDRDSSTAREETQRAIRDLESIMDPDSVVSLVGTHWHYDDTYMWIRRELNRHLAAEGKQQWRVFVETPFEADGVTERFSRILPDLDEIKIKRGLIEYYANYMNNPQPPETQLFGLETLSFFDIADTPPESVRYGYWDPASTEKRAGRDPDFHCISVCAIVDGYIDIIDVWMKQGKPSAGYAASVELCRAHRITGFRVETNHLPDAQDNLNDLFRKNGIGTGVSGVKNTAAKDARIQALEPLTSAGRIRFRSDWRECSNSYRMFMEQITMYPVASHDDAPDSLAGLYDLAAVGVFDPSEVRTSDAESDADAVFNAEEFDSLWSKYVNDH